MIERDIFCEFPNSKKCKFLYVSMSWRTQEVVITSLISRIYLLISIFLSNDRKRSISEVYQLIKCKTSDVSISWKSD